MIKSSYLRKMLFHVFILVILFIISSAFVTPIVKANEDNLIVNGGFESDPNINGTWQFLHPNDKGEANFIWDDEIFHGASGYSLQLEGNNTVAIISNKISVEQNMEYNFSAWVKANDVTVSNDEEGTYIGLMQYDSEGNQIDATLHSYSKKGTFNWSKVNCNFIANSNTDSIVIMLVLDGSGSVWYDDVSLTAGDIVPAATNSIEAVPGPARSTYKGFKVKLNGSNSIGNSLSYSWRIISKPSGSKSELSENNKVNPYFTPDVVGDYVIGLVVNDGNVSSQEKNVTIRVKDMKDVSDDVDYYQMDESSCIEGYTFNSIVPLSDGWVIIGDTSKNQIVIMNGITGEIAKQYQLQASPTNIDFDFENNIIIATQKPTNRIAKIDVDTDQINYITLSGEATALTAGEGNIAFVGIVVPDNVNVIINIVDLKNNILIKKVTSSPYEDIGFMKYDKVNNNLIFGESGYSPSSLYRFTYDTENQTLTKAEGIWDAGTNGSDLTISEDGKHIAFCCGSGNGQNYTIYDYDSSNLNNKFGEWNTGAYPTSADFSYDNKYMVANNLDKIMLFDVNTHSLVKNISTLSDSINFFKVRFSRGNSIIYNCVGNKIYLKSSGINPSNDSVALDSISTDKDSPQSVGQTINITANATGGSNIQYGFLIYDGNSWITAQAFSDKKTFSWVPSKPGIYTIATEVRDINSLYNYDDIYVMNYVITETDKNTNASVKYCTHVQDVGWQDYVSDGVMSGTTGRSLRLEGIKIKIENDSNLGIEYTTHVQDYGWQDFVSNDAMSGTSGQSKRLEAIKIRLIGADADQYDVYYRVHAQDYGWLDWAKNGMPAGTEGLSKRLEGIEIRIVKKSDNVSFKMDRPFVSAYGTASVSYRTHVQDIGWQDYVSDGNLSGTTGQSKRLEAINIMLTNNSIGGGVAYSTHVQDYGWMDYVSDGAMSGTQGQSKRLEAIKINLTGNIADRYDIYYRVHAQEFGWMGWAKNGEAAGTAGYSYRLEGIQVVLVAKGGAAPGSTDGAYIQR